MASYTAYHLTFKTGLHLGRYTGPAQRGQLGLQRTEVCIPADTLFSALCQTWAMFHGSDELETFLNCYKADEAHLPFRLTSAFPFAGDVRFFPKPSVHLDIKDYKKFKNVQFVSYNVFKAILDGKTPELEDHLINGGKMWVDATEKEKLKPLLKPLKTNSKKDGDFTETDDEENDDLAVWKTDTRPRVTLDRRSYDSQIWHVETLTFNKGCGLWFAAQFDTEKTEKQISTLLSVLGDAGIGGERNAGYGMFEFEKKSIELDTEHNSSRFVTLAPICPKNKDELEILISKDTSYSLNPRSGWGNSTGTPFARKKVMMFDEGSVLMKTDGQVGRLVGDLEPDGDDACTHPVYRYGYAWPVGIKGGQS